MVKDFIEIKANFQNNYFQKQATIRAKHARLFEKRTQRSLDLVSKSTEKY
ncbi:23428_t:CDS:2 [Gigaspora margarita]|uniref:23428_t:CDS:1 n=1 Tax=Gigaspora margarita TaxID=4874 RepID=A0ABM8VVY7_GIGMA|nr:23428_t:CDS:2 [Gigaspora margarita]